MAKKPGKDKANSGGTIALNKRARHDYHLEERFEAGMALQGWELKAIRAGREIVDADFLPALFCVVFCAHKKEKGEGLPRPSSLRVEVNGHHGPNRPALRARPRRTCVPSLV